MIVVLTGGSGGAKFVDGLRSVIPPEQITIVVNTADDLEWWGLHVSPDLDSVTYMLAGLLSKERGWGVQSDTFFCLQSMATLEQPTWFQVGDRDLATHLLRTNLLNQGRTLSEATAEICSRLGIRSRALPMSDDVVETRIVTPDRELSFQEYFVGRRFQDSVRSVHFAGIEQAKSAPCVIDAILSADAIVLAPSNPITSIGPILAVPGIREGLKQTSAQIAAISPIIGSNAISGPAGILMQAQGFPVSIAGVAEVYRDFLDLLVVDNRDSEAANRLAQSGVRVHCTNTVMKTTQDRINLAQAVLSALAEKRPAHAIS